MAGMTQDRIVSTEQITPEHIATVIVKQDPFAWFVKCEGGCGRVIAVSKKHYIPLNFQDPHGPVRAQEFTAPGQRRCALCGPRPGSAAAAALESQRNI